jgi:PAS domain S-box-containing protein
LYLKTVNHVLRRFVNYVTTLNTVPGYTVLNTTMVLFTLSALLVRMNAALDETGFLRWYGTALGLIATGLAGVALLKNLNDPINWIGRFAQYLGGVYMLVAVLTSFRYSGAWVLPLEKALRESEDRYQSLVNLSPDAIMVHADGKYVFANPAAVAMLGACSPAEIVGREVLAIVHPDQRRAVRERIERASGGEPVLMTETVLMRLDGSSLDVEVTAAQVSYGGKPANQAMIRDITESQADGRKNWRITAAIWRSRSTSRLGRSRGRPKLLDVTHDAIIVRDRDGKIRYWNTGAERMYGYPRDLAIGQVAQSLTEDETSPNPVERNY